VRESLRLSVGEIRSILGQQIPHGPLLPAPFAAERRHAVAIEAIGDLLQREAFGLQRLPTEAGRP
jgi:hypothetical protein